jgi:cystathionine beta-lyase
MSNYDFDASIDRRGTDSLKYDCVAQRGMPDGLLPMWVADMDFRTADPVRAALRSAADFGVFGYTVPGDAYYDALRDWWSSRFGYDFDARSVVTTPGVVFALAQAVRAFTEPGDAVLIQRPVYYPFTEVVRDNGRRLVNSPLVLEEAARGRPAADSGRGAGSGSAGDGTAAGSSAGLSGARWRMDFEDFERKLAEERPKLFLLCSPHNPVGRVWTRGELARVGDLCMEYGCIVVSDEIHADFVYGGHPPSQAGAERRHTVFSTVKDAFRGNAVVCTSPSKSFNLAGLQISNIIVEDDALRRRFRKEIGASGYSQPSLPGVVACRAAYEQGAPWLAELLAYLEGNLALLREAFPSAAAPIRLIEPEGTYLPLLDFRGTGLSDDAVDERVVHKARLWLDRGTMFGSEGAGFQRINIACPRAVLEDAVARLQAEFVA